MSQQGYIGRNPGDGRTIVNRQTSHVTTGVQTSFTMTVGYEIGYLDVYLNGIKQTETLDILQLMDQQLVSVHHLHL